MVYMLNKRYSVTCSTNVIRLRAQQMLFGYMLKKCYSVTCSTNVIGLHAQQMLFGYKIKTGVSCSTYRVYRNAYNILTGKAEGKKPLGRQKHR